MRPAAALALLALASTAAAGPVLEGHWVLRAVAGGLRQSPAEYVYWHPLLGTVKRRAFAHELDAAGQLSLRSHGSLGGERIGLVWNLLLEDDLSTAGGLDQAYALPQGRSGLLRRTLSARQDERIFGEVDQLFAAWQGEASAFKAGRQAINLGENFFFSPLDLFLPFDPLATYRDFRPGVDALRATWNAGRFTFIEAIAVAGYEPLASTTNTGDHRFRLDGPTGQGSCVLRAQSGGDAWKLTALGGRARDQAVAGGAIQVEAWASWTLEGLYSRDLAPWSVPTHHQSSTLGVLKQVTEDLSLRYEYNIGTHYSEYPGHWRWCGVDQGALGANWQAGPLLSLSPSLLFNDGPFRPLFLLIASLSTGDESSLDLNFSAPLIFANANEPLPTSSESQPTALRVESRWEW